mgnify:CR=1 FL=1
MALTKVTEKVITNNLSISGIASASNFKTGTTNIHSVGVEAAGINVLGGDTPIGSGSTIYDDGGARFSGIVTATSFVGSGANLTGIDATSIKHTDGSVKVQATGTGANLTGNLSVSGNLGVAGVLTYEDVTNVDSIGIITARSTVSIADSIIHTGDTNTSLRFPAADTITAETGGSERLRIASDGATKVCHNGGAFGVGGDPINKFGITASDNNFFGLHRSNASTGTGEFNINVESNSQVTFSMDDEGAFSFGTSTDPSAQSGYSEKLRINSSGHLSVGGSNVTDVNLLTLNGSGAAQNIGIVFNKTNSPARAYGINVHNGTGDLIFYDYTANADRIRISSDGDVVIGTSSWSYKKPLNVQGSSGSILALSNYDTTTYAANTNTSIELRLKTGNTGSQDGSCEIRAFKENGTNGNNARGLNFWTAASGASPSEKFRITSHGDVYSTNSAYNTYDTAATSVNTIVEANENRPGVYWLDFNNVKFRAYIKPNWLQGRNWVLAAKYFDPQDMPSGSSLWTNDTYINESDFNLYGGLMSKYRSWRYFSFNRLAMQMGNRIPPIMQFNSNQTLYGAFSGGYASNGGGVTANSTDPSLGTGTDVTYHSMDNYAGPDFHDTVGSEDRLGSYGLNKWANASTNSTSANNTGSVGTNSAHWDEVATVGAGYNAPSNNVFNSSSDHSLDYRSLKGWRMTVEDSVSLTGVDSLGRAGAWIGCPLDEGNSTQTANGSNVGADSGFGLGGGAGNPGRSWTSGYAEWGQGNYVVNCLPAYIWLSID